MINTQTDNLLIKKAFENVDRKNFVLPEYKNFAHLDRPLSIGYGQTISQPWTVKQMVESAGKILKQ